MLSQPPELLLDCRMCPLVPGDKGVVLLAPELACGQAGQRLVGRKSTASYGYLGPSLQEDGLLESRGWGGVGWGGRMCCLWAQAPMSGE